MHLLSSVEVSAKLDDIDRRLALNRDMVFDDTVSEDDRAEAAKTIAELTVEQTELLDAFWTVEYYGNSTQVHNLSGT